MSTELVIEIFGFLVTIGGFVFYFGQMDVKIKNMESRMTEDRDKNSEQHREFYLVKTEVTQITTQFVDFARRLSDIEETGKEILSRLPNRRTNNV